MGCNQQDPWDTCERLFARCLPVVFPFPIWKNKHWGYGDKYDAEIERNRKLISDTYGYEWTYGRIDVISTISEIKERENYDLQQTL